MITILFILVAVLTALNIKTTLVLARCAYYDTKQKLFQLALVWLLPVVGAILVWSLATDAPCKRVSTDLNDRGGNDDGHIRLDSSAFEGITGEAGDGD